MNIITLDRQKKVLVFAIFVFLFSFLWQIFLTSGITFFWEDIDIFHLYWSDSVALQNLSDKYHVQPSAILPLRLSIGLSIAKEFVKKYFVIDRLFQIGFDPYNIVDRPYQHFMWDLMRIYFGAQPIGYTIFNALFFAIICAIIFYVISSLSLSFALLGTAIFATSSELWLATVSKNHYAVFALCSTFFGVLLFINLTERKTISYITTFFYYTFIIAASNFASLTLGDGRYLAIVFFITLLLFQREKLRFHLPMLIILFMTEIPLLGYVKKMFFDHSFSPINFSTHLGTSLSAFRDIKSTIANYKFVRNALGSFLLVVFYITLSINILYLLLRKNSSVFKQSLFYDVYIRRRIFLFTLWFISALAMVARARGFVYDGALSFQLYDLIYFILPFILFLFYYLLSIKNSLQKTYRIIVTTVFLCFIGTQIFYNSVRLNKFRGGWGNYLCVWQNAGKYIENNSKHALALTFVQNHYKPFFFNNLNNKVIITMDSSSQSNFCDIQFIESKFKEGFVDVFVVAAEKLNFKNSSDEIALTKIIPMNGDCGDLYDYLKNRFGRLSKTIVYIHHFQKIKNNYLLNEGKFY